MQENIYKKTVQAVILTAALALTACISPPPAPPPTAQQPAPAPEFDPGFPLTAQVLRIVPQSSLVAITVRRGGPLARMGHDHVVASHSLEGYVSPELGRTALRFRLDQLTVDEPQLRRAAGLETQPSADAIDGTRRNMFTKVLQAEAHPWVLVRASLAQDMLDADITLHGVTRRYRVPVSVQRDAAGLRASGSFVVRQSDFGITPFAVFGGALSVKDELELRFAISARR